MNDTIPTPDAFELAFEAAVSGEPIPPDLPASAEEPGDTDVPAELAPSSLSTTVESVAPQAPLEQASQEPPSSPPVVEARQPEPLPEPLPPVTPPPAVDDAARALEQFTEREQEIFSTVETEFPEIAQLFAAVRRTEAAKYGNLLKEEVVKMRAELLQHVAPVMQEAQVSAQSRHEAAILKVHPDAFTLIPQVDEWVSKQPGFLQDTYNNVLSKGSATQVIELLNVVKRESAPPTAAPPPSIDLEKEDRLKAQEGVRTRSTGGRATAIDPNDYDGAFEKFAASA